MVFSYGSCECALTGRTNQDRNTPRTPTVHETLRTLRIYRFGGQDALDDAAMSQTVLLWSILGLPTVGFGAASERVELRLEVFK